MRPRLFAILMVLPVMALLALPARAAGLREVINALENPFQGQIRDYTADFFQESKIASLDRLQRARGQVKVRFDYSSRPGKVPTVMFHWEYQEPTRQELISDGKTLWVYLPENNQVILSDIEMVSKARDNDPMTFLTGLGQLSRDFLISWAEPNRDVEGNYVLDLRPRRTTALINRMVIVVDRAVIAEAAAAAAAESDPRRPPSRIEPPPGAPTPESFFGDKPGLAGGKTPHGGLIFPILSTTVYDPNGNSTTIEFSDLRVNRGIPAGEFRFIQPAGVEVVRPTGKEMGF